VLTHYDQDVMKSSYKSQFTGLPAIRNQEDQQPMGASGTREHKRVPFYGESSYKATYDKKDVHNRLIVDLNTTAT
jgi:hypothetical protein